MADANKVVVITEVSTGHETVVSADGLALYGSVEEYLRRTHIYDYTTEDLTIETLDYKDFRKDKLCFRIGNIVRWMDKLYIVASYTPYSSSGDIVRSLTLLPFTAANSTSHPSDTWPLNPRCRISSVERLATCMQDFLVAKFLKILNT